MKIAVEGCAHGELDNIYETIKCMEAAENAKIDLLLCCGDFQSARNMGDLSCMAVPAKYNSLRTFYKYYSGEKTAPVLTLFIGGNHEASNYLQELPYGGWVAPNIYYLGYAGVVNIRGIRIAGISGIYKGRDYTKGHHEMPPYTPETIRSVYHTRNVEIFRLKQLTNKVDIMLSHDWPSDVFKHGNLDQLLRYKPFFRDDIEADNIGSPPLNELMRNMKPNYWFSAHLHCKYAALVPHDDQKVTKFLALDKCLPKKRFLQIIDMPHDNTKGLELSYDAEWLAILNSTNHLTSVKNVSNYMPGPNSNERYDFAATEEEIASVLSKFENNLKIPNNFVKTVKEHSDNPRSHRVSIKLNPQTQQFCEKVNVQDPVEMLLKLNKITLTESDEDVALDCDETLNSSRETKLTLNLPPPKQSFDAADDEILAENTSFVTKVSESIPEVDIVEDPKPSGKFKRRNASLYENE